MKLLIASIITLGLVLIYKSKKEYEKDPIEKQND
jgi:hypothetical protein